MGILEVGLIGLLFSVFSVLVFFCILDIGLGVEVLLLGHLNHSFLVSVRNTYLLNVQSFIDSLHFSGGLHVFSNHVLVEQGKVITYD